jgi:transcriptional regulator GlxA family with amidase domain
MVAMSDASFQRYAFIVETAKQAVSHRLDEPICIVSLCASLVISERKLRSAFRAVHGTSPYRFLRSLRMAKARRALMTTDPARATVTRIAMDHGFVELGRFAVEYRIAFGESPSATLQRAQA